MMSDGGGIFVAMYEVSLGCCQVCREWMMLALSGGPWSEDVDFSELLVLVVNLGDFPIVV